MMSLKELEKNLIYDFLEVFTQKGAGMEKIIAYSVEELYEKVAEQEKRISEIEMRLGIKPQEETLT